LKAFDLQLGNCSLKLENIHIQKIHKTYQTHGIMSCELIIGLHTNWIFRT